MKTTTRRKPLRRSLPRLPFLSLQMLEGRDVPAFLYVDPTFAVGGPNDTDADAATAGNQPAAFGTFAFNTINSALALAVSSDSVVVNGNVYASDDVNLTAVNTGVNLIFQQGFDAGLTVSSVNSIAAATGSANITVNSIKLATAVNNTTSLSTKISMPIDGTGGLLKRGTGTLTLSAANTFSGGTFVSAGTLMGTTGATTQKKDSAQDPH